MRTAVHTSFTPSTQKVGTMQMPVNWWINKQKVIDLCIEI